MEGSAIGSPPAQLLLDFDGTLVEPNVAMLLVSEFAPDGTRLSEEVDLELHRGEITLRQAWEREAALLPWDRLSEMVDFVKARVPLRAGARQLIELARQHGVPTTIISGGLDFYISAVLAREKLELSVLSDLAIPDGAGGLRVLHPHGHPSCRLCGICKAQAVLGFRRDGSPTLFVGDGSTDRYAAEVAEIVFARRRLIEICRAREIPFFPFEQLHPVRTRLGAWLRREEPWPSRPQLGLAGSLCPLSDALATASAPE